MLVTQRELAYFEAKLESAQRATSKDVHLLGGGLRILVGVVEGEDALVGAQRKLPSRLGHSRRVRVCFSLLHPNAFRCPFSCRTCRLIVSATQDAELDLLRALVAGVHAVSGVAQIGILQPISKRCDALFDEPGPIRCFTERSIDRSKVARVFCHRGC